MRYYGQLHDGLDEHLEKMCLTHVKYMNPEDILKDDNIPIMGCSSTHVWFAKLDSDVSKKAITF